MGNVYMGVYIKAAYSAGVPSEIIKRTRCCNHGGFPLPQFTTKHFKNPKRLSLLSASHHSGRYSNSGRKKNTNTSAKNGIIANDRTSTLLWPKQACPPDQAWALWRNCLRILETNGTLIKPLGKWTQPTHQKWSWFKNPHATSSYHRYGDNSWKFFPRKFSYWNTN
jgi:hypothetical protein